MERCVDLLSELGEVLVEWPSPDRTGWFRVLNLVKFSSDEGRMLSVLHQVTGYRSCLAFQQRGQVVLALKNNGRWYVELYREGNRIGISIWAPDPYPIRWFLTNLKKQENQQ